MSEGIYRDNKARLFAFIFGREENRKWTLELYNAANGTHYTDPNEIKITTIAEVVYMGMHNDLSFIMHGDLSLYEHQSSYNPNMPVRQLMYLGRLYDKHIKSTGQNIYSEKLMSLPLPKLIVFYNGKDDKTDCTLRLSDSFPEGSNIADSDVEVTVHMVNIRPQYKSHFLDECRPLAEYSWFVEEVRTNNETKEISDAIDKAIDDMPEDYELKPFLIAHKAEVKDMCLTEYNEAETMQMFEAEGMNKMAAKVIRNMLLKGQSDEDIMSITECSKDKIDEIRRTM